MLRFSILISMLACAAVDSPTTKAPSGGGKADGDGTSTTLLDCNTSVGPDQQVTVTTDGTSLTLVELTTSGSEVQRVLDPSEWSAESFALRDDLGSPTTFAKTGGDWIVQSDSDYGVADCWVDQSN